MLVLKNINKTFYKGTPNEKVVMNNLSLTLNDGDFVTVIGSNGAGKSTLLNIIAGSVQEDSGEIMLDDINLSKLKEHKRAKYFGRVFQDPMVGTCPDMQIEENLALSYRRGQRRTLKWQCNDEERAQYRELLKLLNLHLEDRLTWKVGLLSGGQRQSLTLLMATLKKPNLLLLDEHTAALDPKTAKTVLDITDNIVKEKNITTLMITHNMRDAITYGNRLIMMNQGNIIYDVSGEEKKNLTIEILLKKFESVGNMANDKMILS